MLDNLVNPNLSGLTGSINWNSSDIYSSSVVQMLPSIIVLIIMAIFFIGLISIIARLVNGSKSEQYRRLMVDMLVVGEIKKIATEENIDLIKELSEFSKIEKKAKISEKGLDSVIENELKEKVAKVQEEKF